MQTLGCKMFFRDSHLWKEGGRWRIGQSNHDTALTQPWPTWQCTLGQVFPISTILHGAKMTTRLYPHLMLSPDEGCPGRALPRVRQLSDSGRPWGSWQLGQLVTFLGSVWCISLSKMEWKTCWEGYCWGQLKFNSHWDSLSICWGYPSELPYQEMGKMDCFSTYSHPLLVEDYFWVH